jgi:hypothetical protein
LQIAHGFLFVFSRGFAFILRWSSVGDRRDEVQAIPGFFAAVETRRIGEADRLRKKRQ